MNTQVEEYIANLLSLGLSRSQVSEKTYDYALALLLEEQAEGASVTAAMMAQAAMLVRDALPKAYRLYETKQRIW